MKLNYKSHGNCKKNSLTLVKELILLLSHFFRKQVKIKINIMEILMKILLRIQTMIIKIIRIIDKNAEILKSFLIIILNIDHKLI